jgi:hypothetical protein
MNSGTLNTIQGTIQDVRFMVEPVVSDPTKITLSNRIFNFFDAWTNASYDAWEKSGRPEREF